MPADEPPPNRFPLPPELVDRILGYLTPLELSAVSRVCRALSKAAADDQLWRAFVQENVPGTTVTSPAPCASFRELYAAHDPYWFIARYKIWICGCNSMTGRVVIARFDPDKGRIEGYRLVAIPWNDDNPQPPTHGSFSRATSMANLLLSTDRPEIMMDPLYRPRRIVRPDRRRAGPGPSPLSQSVTATASSSSASASASAPLPALLPAPVQQPRCLHDVPMLVRVGHDELGLIQRKLIFAARLAENGIWDPETLWPPPRIPAPHRVACQYVDADIRPFDGTAEGVNIGHQVTMRPRQRAALSDHGFYVRKWADKMPVHTYDTGNRMEFVPQPHLQRCHDHLDTFATIDPVYYTPTADKPFRGIFVGDYGMHGYELVLMHQPDDAEPFDEEAEVPPRLDGETAAAYEERRRNARVHRGRLEAVKLTGDPSVPCGEVTFVASDLGLADNSGINQGIVAGSELESLRRVCCSGQVAEEGFRFGRWHLAGWQRHMRNPLTIAPS